jgi:hypothetical protein
MIHCLKLAGYAHITATFNPNSLQDIAGICACIQRAVGVLVESAVGWRPQRQCEHRNCGFYLFGAVRRSYRASFPELLLELFGFSISILRSIFGRRSRVPIDSVAFSFSSAFLPASNMDSRTCRMVLGCAFIFFTRIVLKTRPNKSRHQGPSAQISG